MKKLILFIFLLCSLCFGAKRTEITVSGQLRVFETDFRRNPISLVLAVINDSQYAYYVVRDVREPLLRYIGKTVTITGVVTTVKIIDTASIRTDTFQIFGKTKLNYTTIVDVDTIRRNYIEVETYQERR